MAIRIIQTGEIHCDVCKKIIATMQASSRVFDVLTKEAKFVAIRCNDCTDKPIPNEESK